MQFKMQGPLPEQWTELEAADLCIKSEMSSTLIFEIIPVIGCF